MGIFDGSLLKVTNKKANEREKIPASFSFSPPLSFSCVCWLLAVVRRGMQNDVTLATLPRMFARSLACGQNMVNGCMDLLEK
jgi:hypothetical protein